MIELTSKQKYFKIYREQHKERAKEYFHGWWIRVGKQRRIGRRLKAVKQIAMVLILVFSCSIAWGENKCCDEYGTVHVHPEFEGCYLEDQAARNPL